MASLLLGTAAMSATATAAAVPATAGLFGTAGAFALPQALMTVGTGVAAAGGISGGMAAASQAEAAQNLANFNAAVQEQEARAIKERAKFAQKRQAERGARVKSALEAALGKVGGLGAPVAADLAAEQAAELELENLLIGFEGEIGARRALSQAEIDRISGKIVKQRGRAARTAGFFGAGGTLLTGFGSVLKE